ncbi:MAG: hypothetical protein OEW06_03870, partial [Gemmatimonadota bacterium]|nr:hypothetical protein [Gemmatimonadota bacterium]
MSRSSPVRSLRAALDLWPSPGSLPSLGLLLVVMSLTPEAGSLAAQVVPLAPGSGVIVYSVPSVDPSRLPNTGPYPATYWVVNQSVSPKSFDFYCTTSGPVSCDNVNPTSGYLNEGESMEVSLTYSTLSTTGAGAVGLVAVEELNSDTGWLTVGVYNGGKGGIAFLNRNLDNVDRGLCFTVGAGEGAGLTCGDLFVVQGMPGYRSLGKDRSLSLHYNSATATGLTLVAGRVSEPATIAMPSTVRVILTVNGTLKDSTTVAPPSGYNCVTIACSDTFQVVVGRNLNWSSLPTGYYPATLTLRNLYPAVFDSVVSGNVLVVNRSVSEYGRGWALLGLEQVLIDPSDSTRRVWVAGDGSIRVYQRGAGVTAGQLTASGLAGFSAANSVDGTLTNTAWTTSSGTSTAAYVRADLGATFLQAVTSARLYAATATNATYDVQYSSNGTTWATVLSGFKPQAGWSSVVWSSVGAYRYWRLKVAANNGAGSTIRELSFGASNNYYGAPGDAPDSLVRFDTLGTKWYRRPLRHGTSVTLDNTGRHRLTTNRVGHRTTFSWTTVAGQPRLATITVPPNDATSRNFILGWNPTTGLLETITDPGGRQLRTSMAGGNLFKIVLPGKLDSTRFAYDARNVLVKRIASRQPGTTKGDSASTAYTYGNNARVTAVAIQADSAGTSFTTTTVTPWDERGFTALVESDTAVNGLSTRVDGPIPGTGDAVDVAVDRFGQPMRTWHVGLGTMTVMARDSSKSLPALLTRVQYPHPTAGTATGRVVRLSWNARGNLTEQRDSTSHLGTAGLATKVLRLTYGDGNSPDAPTRAEDALGRRTDYAYHAVLGLTDSVIDPRGHATKFFFRTSGVLAGVIDSVAERRVATWVQSSGTDVVQDQTNRFTYDGNGNVQRATSPAGAVTSYVLDNLGRITDAYDPLGTRMLYAYDSLNRITAGTLYTAKQLHPGGLNPLAGVPTTQFDTTDVTQPFPSSFPGTLLTRYTR